MDKIYRNRKHRLVYPEQVTADIKLTTLPPTAPHWTQVTCNSAISGGHHMIISTLEEETDVISVEDDNHIERKDEASQSQEGNNGSNNSVSDQDSRYDSQRSQLIRERIRHLARAFSDRALRVRRRFDFPPTPSTVSSDPEDGNNVYPSPMRRRDQIVKWMSEEWGSTVSMCDSIRMKIKQFTPVVEPQSYFYVGWLSLVMIAYLYNCFTIPLRITFPYQTPENTFTWFMFDCSMDAIYLLDVALIKPRIMYLDDGFWVRNAKLTRKYYMKKSQFKTDVLSLTPIDLLYLKFGIGHPLQPLLRLQRLLKVQTFWEFFDYFDNVMSSPYVMRVARSLTYMIYLVHLNACAYYVVSVKEGLGSNSWVFNGEGNAYIRCFYFATKTATSIGKNPRPENELEYLFMTGCWLMGVFVFALLIGQIRDIIATATRSQTEYRKRVDETLDYLRRLNLPPKLIERVKMWFSFTWQQQHTLDESRILDNLPHKMKTDVAINVHINTLNKVQLFQNCDEALLRELVLKLRPVLYLPGDYICRKGEVGKEMYIVKTGQVQVVSGDDGSVLATLTEGSVFGEISLLSLSGGNRRTADVRSHGFSNLFVLSKDDLNEALVFYPNAQEILKKKAKQLMRQNAARERRNQAEVVIGNMEPAAKVPRLLPIVMRVLPPDSKSARLLKYGSRRSTRTYDFERSRNKTASFSTNTTNKRPVNRCHSVDLGNLQAYKNYRSRSTTADLTNTFQCHVTVHREMSK